MAFKLIKTLFLRSLILVFCFGCVSGNLTQLELGLHLAETRGNRSLALDVFSADLVTQCAVACVDNWRCESFSYSIIHNTCILSEAEEESDWEHDQDYNSYLRSAISLDQAQWAICEVTTCRVEELCISDRTKNTCVCDGFSEEGKVCMKKGAAEPRWADWTEWTSCSKTCSLGVKSRTRECSSGFVQDCDGNHMEIEQCQIQECPVWTLWNDWTPCSASVTCGTGSQQRNRTCLYDVIDTAENSTSVCLCPGPPEEIKFCETLSCSGPVALFGDEYASGSLQIYDDLRGVWGTVCSDGFDLSDANVACHQMGFEDAFIVAVRNVTSASKATDESPTLSITSNMNCSGEEYTIQSCRHSAWTEPVQCDSGVVSLQCAVNGIWSLWAKWQACSEWCGNGTQLRHRECNSPPALWGGQQCPDSDTDERPCFERPCPVDGEWMDWAEWSTCSQSCGSGEKTRDRVCMMPQHGGDRCEGDGQEIESCNSHACSIDGVWMTWSEWTECSLSCGGGSQSRSRSCHGPFFGGSDCSGDESEEQTCNDVYCPIDGVWMEWGDWSNCSVTCAGGVMYRNRLCEGPFYNGEACVGADVDNATCNEFACPVPGDWNQWTAWSVCNTSCGGGFQLRYRDCELGLHGGSNCTGADSENQECNSHHCPVNGVYEAWSEWYSCSLSCGGGEKLRNRTCEGPFYGGLDCNGSSINMASCNNQSCPIDGVWMEWQDWESCNVTCGGGIQSRSRACDGPYYGGLECRNGSDVSHQSCGENPCLIDGSWAAWMEWGDCSASCGGGVRDKQRVCDGPYHGGADCEGTNTEAESCAEQPCPVDGVWFDWTEWSICNVTCGGGGQFSIRDCDGPFYGGSPCTGEAIKRQNCGSDPCPVDGVWTDWQDWGVCDSTCAYGHQMRSRMCTGPFHGGSECTGPADQTQKCFAAECPMDGFWMEWSDWNDCTLSCGGGTQEKNRTCFGPYFGGLPCEGEETESQACGIEPCPVDGYWADWNEWQQCNVTCAGGLQLRTRDCVEPLYGGADCTGDDSEYQECNENPCPVDGEWSLWTKWGACNVTCAGGLQNRYRICTQAAHGGSDCNGTAEEYMDCNTEPCPIDGVWMTWSNWTNCSDPCGGGYQDRERDCDGPYHGGLNCTGPLNETRSCNIHRCPIDGIFTGWADWTDCPVTCGGSDRYRDRECIGPFYGGLPCNDSLFQTKECNPHPCPINGSYTDWVSWSTCNVSCGTGLQYRERQCNGTAHGGMNCSHIGEAFEEQYCNDFPCPIDGKLTPWSNWTDCTWTCGFGEQYRYRDCDGPFYGGLDCQEALNETRGCNQYYCPIDGYFADWSNWTECTVSCGNGYTTRDRDCIGPYHRGLNCTGDWSQTLDCNTHECPIDGVWAVWSNWTDCSLSCGGGSQARRRVCTGPFYGGLECPGDDSQTRDCNTHHCPIDGVWLDWTEWSECSLTCGTGASLRSRGCDGPFYDGMNCTGDWSESKDCNTFLCPIPGNWTEWTTWSDCSTTCGGGVSIRTRDCDTSWIPGLKAPCEGEEEGAGTESLACHEFSCDTARTCSEWYDRGLRLSGDTIIDPDGEFGYIQPFYVFCDMTINGGETIVKHNHMGNVLVDGYEAKCEYYQEFAYGGLSEYAGLDSAIALVDTSVDCQQFVSWNCVSATINHPSLWGYALTYWMNRDYEERNYIGDFENLSDLDMTNPYDLQGCECSLTGGCGDAGNLDDLALCNCDLNDNTNRTDSGYIKYKPDLPVSAFCAGDTGAPEEIGYFEVGELRCCGTL